MIGRVTVKRLELLGVFYGAELSHIECAVWRQLHAQHVVNAYRGNDRSKQIRMLGDHCAHQQATIASTLNRELSRTRVILVDQVLRGRGKIVEYILFFREIASLVPFFAEFTTASDVCHHVHAIAIEPKSQRKIKVGRHADSVATVCIEQRRVVSVALHSFSRKDIQWNFRAVFRTGELAAHFYISERDWRRAL